MINQPKTQPLSRRQFLQGLFVALGSSLFAACGVQRSVDSPTSLRQIARPHPILPSPQPPVAQATTAAQPDGVPLAAFLALSALLTGIDNLNPVLGRVYLQSLQATPQAGATLAQLFDAAGLQAATPPTTLAAIEQRGIFEQAGTRTLANKIIEYWYTGIYETAEGEAVVATYVDALVWQAISFTKPTTICGAPGFWSEAPEGAID